MALKNVADMRIMRSPRSLNLNKGPRETINQRSLFFQHPARAVKLETQAQIAKMTLSLLAFAASLFLLGLLVLVFCAGLGMNPFRESTTSFLFAAFGGLIGASAILVLLNVATNLSLIADAKIAELKVVPNHANLRTWYIGFLITAAALVCLIFAGTYLSKEKYLGIVRTQADQVLKENKILLEEISALLASGRPPDYKRITEIISFLKHQRSGLPDLTLIYSGQFADKQAFLKLGEHFSGDLAKDTYSPTYFPCTQNLDCDILRHFFSGKEVDVLQKYTLRDGKFYIYIPVIGKEARFILLFDRSNRYGKVGSF